VGRYLLGKYLPPYITLDSVLDFDLKLQRAYQYSSYNTMLEHFVIDRTLYVVIDRTLYVVIEITVHVVIDTKLYIVIDTKLYVVIDSGHCM